MEIMLAVTTRWLLSVTRPAMTSYRSTLLLYDRELGHARQWCRQPEGISWSWHHCRELSSNRSRVTPKLVEADKHTPNEKDQTAVVRPGARRRWKAWSAQEIARLREMRTTGSSWSQVGAALPTRSLCAISAYAYSLGLTQSRGIDWLPDENAKLLKLRAQGENWHTINKSMPNRSRQALMSHYNQIRLREPISAPSVNINAATVKIPRGSDWSVAEVEQFRHFREEMRLPLRDIYPRMSHRSPSAIMSFSRSIRPQKCERWSAEETSKLQILRERHPQVEWPVLAAQFPGRTAYAVLTKWYVTRTDYPLRVSWSRAERAKLSDLRMRRLNWRETTARFPNRTAKAVMAQYYRQVRGRDFGQTSPPTKEA